MGAGPRHVATRYDVEAIRLGARTVEAMGLDRPADEATAAEALQMLRPLRTVARYLLEGDDEEDWHARRFYERLENESGAAFEAAYRQRALQAAPERAGAAQKQLQLLRSSFSRSFAQKQWHRKKRRRDAERLGSRARRRPRRRSTSSIY